MSAVLSVDNLSKRFGGIFGRRRRVVRGARRRDSRHHRTERLGQIDAVQLCAGPDCSRRDGEVRVDGRPTTGMRPCDINRLGVSRTFQLLQVFPQLSVRDNLILAGQEHQGSMVSRLFGASDAGLHDQAQQMIEFFRLAIWPKSRPAC